MSDNFPQVRSMTRRELKALRNAGLDPVMADEQMTVKDAVKMYDFILETCYPDFDFDDYPESDCIAFAMEVYNTTYGRKIDEKN